MRILHILRPAAMGGAERHLMATLPALADRGLDVRFVLLARPAPYRPLLDALSDAGVDVTVIQPPGPHANPITPLRFLRQIRRHRPDLVHTHSFDGDLYGGLAARAAGQPSVSTIHGTYPFYERGPFAPVARFAGRLATAVIAPGEFVADFVRRARLARPDRVHVIPHGIDLPEPCSAEDRRRERERLGAESDEVVVVVASRLAPFKGIDVVIDAAADAFARAPSLRLWVAGDGPARHELRSRAAARLPVHAYRFLGFVDDVPSLLAAADVFAFPTVPGFSEGFPFAPLEGMAAGLPVVASAVYSLPEQVADRETGILVAPGEVGALADALVELANDRDLRRRLGAAGWARVRRRFPLAANVDALSDVYRGVLARRR